MTVACDPPIGPPPASLGDAVQRARALSVQGCDGELIGLLRSALEHDAVCPAAGSSVQRAFALALIGQSLTRQARYAEAIHTYACAPREIDGPGYIEARVRILLGLAFVCTHRAVPEQALKVADAALRLALAHEMLPLAAAALECAGIAYGLQGDLARADRLMHEALGLALQAGDDVVLHRCLNSLLFLSQNQFDVRRDAGEIDGARFALGRCARFVARGDRLASRIGVYERCQWRSNRAGWQRRRGSPQDAQAAFVEVEREAREHGWPVLLAFAQLDLAGLQVDAGRENDALAVLDDVLAIGPSIDLYDLRLRAHRLAQEILIGQGRPVDASAHRLAHARLLRESAAQRARTVAWLPQLGDAVLEALAAADKARIDGTLEERLRRQVEAQAVAFLGSDAIAALR